jgi:hypothetical protein
VLWKTVCLGRAVAAIRPLLFKCVSQILGQMQTENTFLAYGLTWNEKLVRIVQYMWGGPSKVQPILWRSALGAFGYAQGCRGDHPANTRRCVRLADDRSLTAAIGA